MALVFLRNFARSNTLHHNFTNPIVNSTVRYVCSNSFVVQSPEDFKDKVINSAKPIVVQFHAPWCGPCKILGPRIEKVVDEKKGKIILALVNIDDNTEVAFDYDVKAIPVIAVFRKGELVERLTGVQDEDKLRTFVGKFVAEE